MRSHLILRAGITLILGFASLGGKAMAATGAAATAAQDGADVSTKSCLSEVNPAWSEPEKRVWNDLCNGQEADLSPEKERVKNVKPVPGCAAKPPAGFALKDVSGYANEPSRRVSGEFLQEIVGKEKYARYFANRPIRIVGAFIPSMRLHDGNIQSLTFDKSLIDDMELTNLTLGSWLAVCDSSVPQKLVLSDVTARQVDFYRVANAVALACDVNDPPCFGVEDSKISTLRLVNVIANNVKLSSSHFDRMIFINADQFTNLKISDFSTAYTIAIHGTTLASLSLEDVDVTRQIKIGGNHWKQISPPDVQPCTSPMPSKEPGESQLSMNGVSAPEFLSFPAKNHLDTNHPEKSTCGLPDSFTYVESSFGSSYLAGYPLGLLERIKDPVSALDLYTVTSKTYEARGELAKARDISYHREVLRDAGESALGKFARRINRIVVGYGYYPERGLGILLLLVLLGWPIFATGAARLINAQLPRSWLVFSLDTMIPIIELDPKSGEVAFKGPRQYYLYFMRLLGAALAFLVFAYLKQTFVGPD